MKRLLIFFFLSILIKAEIFDLSIPENDTASYTYADFRIWINESTDTLRGVYWFMHPNNGDSRNIVTDTAYQNLAQEQDFALLGAHIFNMHMDTGIGDAVIAAMDSFAILSQHQEISFIPFFINGHSWGGQFAYHFTKWKPERVAGFITQKGGYHDTTNAELAIQVPALMIVGENDLDYRIENLTNIFLNHRPAGAKWILAMEPGVGHTLVTDYSFLNSFFNTVVNLRIPDNTNLYEPIVLNSLSDSIGWLGNQDTYTIGSWECYNSNIDSSSWFPSRNIGEKWQNFVSEYSTDTSSCYPTLDSSYVLFNVGIHGENDESNFIVATNNSSLIGQCYAQLDLPEIDRILHINGFLDQTNGGINNPWNWHIIPNEWVLAEMSVGVCNGSPFDVENNLDYWINDVGQLCNWGSYIKNEIISGCNSNEVSLWDSCYSIANTTELDLSGYNLSGPIDPQIGALVNLNYINLRSNNLTGSIPNSLGNLTNLTTLSLSDNFLEGEIPVELEGLANLENLYLHNNQLTGEVPNIFHEMDSLVHLTLFENQFNGNIPESICNVYNNLEYLGLYSNLFCPPYPNCITFEDLGSQDTTNCDFAFIDKDNNFSDATLFNVYPNPFNPIINIHFSTPSNSSAAIFIYDITGKKIYSFLENKQVGGYQSFQINGSEWVSGIYFIELKTGKNKLIKKVMLIK